MKRKAYVKKVSTGGPRELRKGAGAFFQKQRILSTAVFSKAEGLPPCEIFESAKNAQEPAGGGGSSCLGGGISGGIQGFTGCSKSHILQAFPLWNILIAPTETQHWIKSRISTQKRLCQSEERSCYEPVGEVRNRERGWFVCGCSCMILKCMT